MGATTSTSLGHRVPSAKLPEGPLGCPLRPLGTASLAGVIYALGCALLGFFLIPPTASARQPRPGDTLSPMVPEHQRAIEVRSTGGVVVANTREAAAAGARILSEGGNAVDAAVATALALGVSETEASGLGGQAWMVIHMADGRDIALDGSGKVPDLVKPQELQRLADEDLLFGYKFVATPEAVAVLDQALRKFGTKSVAEVMAPAIELADYGVRLTPHQDAVLLSFGWRMRSNATLRDIFFNASLDEWESDHIYCMDQVGSTMRRLAQRGFRDFYDGRIADAIDADMRVNGGYLRKSDLAKVQAVERVPASGTYRGLEVISFPDPGGGPAVVEALQILERFAPERVGGDSTDALVIRLEASRLALYDLFASWLLGPTAAPRMLDPQLAARRAAMINPRRALRDRDITGREMVITPRRLHGSTHVSVLDARGDAVALTLSYNVEFGAAVATPGLGFPYNATLSVVDFDNPTSPRYARPGTVPKEVVSPTILLRDGKPFMVLGGPGSGRITSTIANTIVNVVDRHMTAGDAVAHPRVLWSASSQPAPYVEMAYPFSDAAVAELNKRGYPSVYVLRYPARVIDAIAFGGVNLAMYDSLTGEAVGAGDPRRAGTAVAAGKPEPPSWK
jgi:gamma-glutamyltranspeptidase/glutathione hydrolase